MRTSRLPHFANQAPESPKEASSLALLVQLIAVSATAVLMVRMLLA